LEQNSEAHSANRFFRNMRRTEENTESEKMIYFQTELEIEQ